MMRFLGPFFIFLLLVGLLYKGLGLDPKGSPPALLNKPSPVFEIGTIEDPTKRLNESLYGGKVTVLNVWASWCSICEMEHRLWMKLSKAQEKATWQLVGLNYHDRLEDAQAFLAQHGNPYSLNLFDGQGAVGIEYGVYGTPETFVIDRKGIIRYRHQGALSEELWKTTVLPLIKRLNDHGEMS